MPPSENLQKKDSLAILEQQLINVTHGKESEIDEVAQQQDFEDKMDMFLLGDNLPVVEQLAEAESSQSSISNSDMTSQNSQIINQRSMPMFLQQLQSSVEQRSIGPNKEQVKKFK